MTMGSGVCIYSTGNINFREMFKNYEKKYVKPKQDENYNTEEPDEATEATEDIAGKAIRFWIQKSIKSSVKWQWHKKIKIKL